MTQEVPGPESTFLSSWLRYHRRPTCPVGLACQLTGSMGEGLDWDAIFARAHAQGIAPILYATLVRWKIDVNAPRFVRFGAAHGATLRQNLLYLDELARIASRFVREGIETIVLKGAALLLTTYPHPALRPMGDLDLLVREADVTRALDAARALGYALLRPGVTTEVLATNHEIELVRTLSDGTRLYLEIHWRLVPRESLIRGADVESRSLWRDALDTGDPAVPARVLAPEDALVFAALHLWRHAFSRAIWLVDVAMLAEAQGLLWEDVATKAREWDAGPPLYVTLGGSRSLCDARIPDGILASIDPGRVREMAVDAILNWQNTFGAHAALGERALSPARRYLLKLLLARDTFTALAGAVRILFPSSAWLRARYDLGANTPTAFARWRHLLAAAREAFRGTGRDPVDA